MQSPEDSSGSESEDGVDVRTIHNRSRRNSQSVLLSPNTARQPLPTARRASPVGSRPVSPLGPRPVSQFGSRHGSPMLVTGRPISRASESGGSLYVQDLQTGQPVRVFPQDPDQRRLFEAARRSVDGRPLDGVDLPSNLPPLPGTGRTDYRDLPPPSRRASMFGGPGSGRSFSQPLPYAPAPNPNGVDYPPPISPIMPMAVPGTSRASSVVIPDDGFRAPHTGRMSMRSLARSRPPSGMGMGFAPGQWRADADDPLPEQIDSPALPSIHPELPRNGGVAGRTPLMPMATMGGSPLIPPGVRSGRVSPAFGARSNSAFGHVPIASGRVSPAPSMRSRRSTFQDNSGDRGVPIWPLASEHPSPRSGRTVPITPGFGATPSAPQGIPVWPANPSPRNFSSIPLHREPSASPIGVPIYPPPVGGMPVDPSISNEYAAPGIPDSMYGGGTPRTAITTERLYTRDLPGTLPGSARYEAAPLPPGQAYPPPVSRFTPGAAARIPIPPSPAGSMFVPPSPAGTSSHMDRPTNRRHSQAGSQFQFSNQFF